MASGNPFAPVAPPLQDPLAAYGRLVALRTAMQQQGLMQGQQQLQQQELQRGQLQLNDQRAMTAAMHDWDGQDVNALPALILKNGGSANAVFGMKNTILNYQTNLQTLTKEQLANEATRNDVIAQHIDNVKSLPVAQQPAAFESAKADLVNRGYLDPQSAQGIAYQSPEQLDLLEKMYMGHSAAVSAAQKTAQAGRDTAEAEQKNLQTQWYQTHGGLPPGITPDMAGYAAYIQNGGTPQNYAGFKAGQEAKARLPYEVQAQVAKARAEQLIQGMVKPGYGFDANGDRVLMSQTEALQNGVKNFVPVTEKELSDDIQLNNRMADVQQKIARYQQTLSQPLSPGEKTVISTVLNEGGLRVGISGTQLPTDWLNKLTNAAEKGHLGQLAQDRLIAYFNAREAMTGYNRVLSGSGRSNEKNLELQLQTLPSPLDPETYSNRAINQFRENLKIVNQGIPIIPGIKRPDEWEQQITQPQVQIPNSLSGGFGNQQRTGRGFWGKIPGAVVRQ